MSSSKDKAPNGGTYLLQAFLNFSHYTAAKQASLTRRASMSSFSSTANLASSVLSMSGVGVPSAFKGATAPVAAISINSQQQQQQQQPQVSSLETPDHPLILRLADGCNAEAATVQALQQHYLTRWVARVQTIVEQMGEQHGIRPSEPLAAELAAVGRMTAGGAKPARVHSADRNHGGGRPRRLSSVEQKKEKTHDEIIRTVLQHEELHFYESVLPSRFVEDYQPFVALCDGSLPQPSTSGAVTTSKPHSQQLVDMNENPKEWAIPSGSIVKQHPKATFPYTITIFYRPTKTSRTMNDIMCRSSSFVLGSSAVMGRESSAPYAGTSDANVTQLVSDRSMILNNSGDPLKSAAQYLVAQSAPKSMLGDDAARKRGFTILPFLPYLKSGVHETHVDPQIAQYLRRLSENNLPGSAQSGSKDSGGHNSATSQVESNDADRDKEIDFTVEELMAQAGLTLYDVARHGNGPLAHLGRDHVVEQVPMMAKSDMERKRQENVIRAERAAIAREETAMRLSEKREASMREEHTAKEAIARVEREKSELDYVREEAARERGKEERRLSLEQRILSYKAAAQKELEESQERQQKFLQQLEMTLDQKANRRRLDTTLEGERTKAEELSRRAGPISLRLNEFRPKVKQLDQQQRQDNMYASLVQSLDKSLTTATTQYHSGTSAALADRHQYETKVREELVVRTADAATLDKKGAVRNFRIEDLKRQEDLVSRAEGEVSILRIAAKPSTVYYCATPEEDASREEERNRNFLEWKERRRVEVEAKMIRSELGIREPRSVLTPS
jgi:hypothetical protein